MEVGMFGRKRGVSGVAEEAVQAVTPYVDQLANDAKLRKRLAAALTASLLARRRAAQHTGMRGLITRLGSDPVLRAQIAEAVTQLQEARRRVEKRKNRRTRMVLLAVAGGGVAVAALPKIKKAIAGGSPPV
jgi:hypothetical protein